ncbi:MAG: GH39 family glycosyl hydrolase [Promethearchaeota archaeon]
MRGGKTQRGKRALLSVALALLFLQALSSPLARATRAAPSSGASSANTLDETGAVPVGDPFGACHADSYDLMADLGVKINRKDITWSGIEPSDDQWSWDTWDARTAQLRSHNMTALPILDYGNLKVQTGTTHGNRIATEHDIDEWLEYVNQSVYRYYINDSLHVSAWEIWNEPNLGAFDASTGFWTGTDEEFFHLQRVTAAMLKQNYPNLTVLSGGISGHDPDYLSRMFEAGAMENIDVLAFHPYSGSAYDSLDVKIKEVQDVCEKYAFNGSMWITEVGMSTQFHPTEVGYEDDYRESLELQASIVPKVYALSLANDVEVVVWYCLGDFANWTWGEGNFGLVYDPSNTFKPHPYGDDVLKPAGYAYRVLAHNLNWSTYYPKGVVFGETPASEHLRTFYFLKPNGDLVLVCWNAFNTEIPVTFHLPVVANSVEAYTGPAYKSGRATGVTTSTSGSETTISARVGFVPVVLVVDLPDGARVPVYMDVPWTFFDFSLLVAIPGLVVAMGVAFAVSTRKRDASMS